MSKKPALPKVVNPNSLFKPPQNENKDPHCTQMVNVQIVMPEKEDSLTGIFRAIGRMFRKGG